MKKLMRYIPKAYKNQVSKIRRLDREWNDVTGKWNYPIQVEWKDGEENTYQNSTYMQFKLSEIGRE